VTSWPGPDEFVRQCVAGASEVTRRRSEFSTSHLVENVYVRSDDGTEVALVLKRLGRDDLLPEAVGTRPPFMTDPSREAFVFRAILQWEDFGTPALYGYRDDPETGQWLLLERVDGIELYQVGEWEIWTEVARRLARLHLALARYKTEDASRRLVRHDAAFYSRWPDRAIEFQAGRPPDERRALADIARRWDDVVERLVALPTTVIHGELYASNVLVAPGTSPLRVCPVDWEMAGVGPGLVDLAALTSGWDGPHRRELASHYHEELSRNIGAVMPFDELAHGLDCCRLYLSVQWLGWAPGWEPPPDHDRDWLGDAVSLSQAMSG
jgi:hypothetical protein